MSETAQQTAKPEPQFFETVSDMHKVPLEKVDHFCEDLRLWLRLHRMVEQLSPEHIAALRVLTPIDKFGWHDDGRHDVTVSINVTTPPVTGSEWCGTKDKP